MVRLEEWLEEWMETLDFLHGCHHSRGFRGLRPHRRDLTLQHLLPRLALPQDQQLPPAA
jgi:hypothetical protein